MAYCIHMELYLFALETKLFLTCFLYIPLLHLKCFRLYDKKICEANIFFVLYMGNMLAPF